MAERFRDFGWRSGDGLDLFARDYPGPDGKLPVVCIPGLTRNSADFEEVAPWIASLGRRVLAVDLRGRGRSSWAGDPTRYKPAQYADDIARLIRAIGTKQAIFAGTSLGGLVTMALAAGKHRKLISGAVLNDVGPKIGAAGIARIASYVGKGAPVRTWDDAAGYAERINAIAFPMYGREEWQRFARRMFKEGDGGVPVLDYDARIFRPAGPIARRIGPWLAWRSFKRLGRGPLLLVRGETSDILEADAAARMRKLVPNMQYAEIPGIGHAPMLTEPEARAALARFLAALP